MANPYSWWRCYNDARTDNKLRLLTDAQHRVWFNLICMASEQHEDRGAVPCDDMDLLAVEAATGDMDLLLATRDQLIRLKIIEVTDGAWRFRRWLHRQYDKPSDWPENVRERVQKHRAKRAETPDPEGVTPGHAMKRDVTRCNAVKRDVTDIEEDSDSDSDSDRIEEDSDTARPRESPSATNDRTSESPKPGGRKAPCPASLTIDDTFRAFRDAEYPTMGDEQLRVYVEDRRDYARERGYRYADWHGTICQWFREAVDSGAVSVPENTPSWEEMVTSDHRGKAEAELARGNEQGAAREWFHLERKIPGSLTPNEQAVVDRHVRALRVRKGAPRETAVTT